MCATGRGIWMETCVCMDAERWMEIVLSTLVVFYLRITTVYGWRILLGGWCLRVICVDVEESQRLYECV